MSHIMCHMPHFNLNFFPENVVELIGGGSVVNGVHPVQFHSCQHKSTYLTNSSNSNSLLMQPNINYSQRCLQNSPGYTGSAKNLQFLSNNIIQCSVYMLTSYNSCHQDLIKILHYFLLPSQVTSRDLHCSQGRSRWSQSWRSCQRSRSSCSPGSPSGARVSLRSPPWDST